MRLSFFGGSRTSGVAHLADVFESQEDAWAFVEDDDGWFRPGEAIHIRHRRLGDRGVIAVGEVEGNLVVDELLTENARIAIDAEPLRTIAASGDPRLFRSALRVVRALSHALAQLEPAPSHDEALAGQHELHDAQEVVEDARDSTGLSELEEILVERWMRADADVLDIGCGTGREALAFAARGMRVTAIDVSHRSVEVARTRAAREFPGDQVHALAGDLTTLQLPYESFDVIFFASDVFASIPRADNRVRILRQAVDLLRPGGRVFVQAIITPHRIRAALLDVARAAMAELRGTPHERGDRWIWKGPPPIRMFRHGFASDEAVVDELERSGLSFVARCGSYVVSEKGAREGGLAMERSFMREAGAVLGALPRVDRVRRTSGPKPASAALRNDGANAPRRDARGRARLARAIELCDRVYPFGRGGCYRRALLEIALDSGAATEPLYLGLADPEGHAWLPRSWPVDRYPAVFTV